jgi:shikimate dehydrogenase
MVPTCACRQVPSLAVVDRPLSKDTQLCISLAGRPSNIGTRFHNHLYVALGLDFVYKACTTDDLPAAIAGLRALGIRGCGISMPFKEACLPLLDELDDAARAIGAVNTVVNDEGVLRGWNTDELAVRQLLRAARPAAGATFALVGSGGMARAVAAALHQSGFTDGVVIARNEDAGREIADRHGFRWGRTIGSDRPHLLVNATPIGMAGGPDADGLPAPIDMITAARLVLDVVAVPVETPLVCAARAHGTPVITGDAVSMRQATEQFVLYTGVRPTDEQVRQATAFAHSSDPARA